MSVEGEFRRNDMALAIDAEVASLHKSIREAHRRLDLLGRLRREYESLASRSTAAAPASGGSRHATAVNMAQALLSDAVGPMKTTEILRHLDSQGLFFKGKNPRATLSVVLSRSGRFIAVGRQGWTVKNI